MANETLSVKKSDAPSMSSTVTVACKIPMGIVLKLYNFEKKHEPVMGGGTREYKIAVERHGEKTYIIDGVSVPQNAAPRQQIAAGYAMTHGIPRAFWDEWLEQNREADYVRNGMIFAHGEANSAIAEAKEKESLKSGLERMDPSQIHKHGLQAAAVRA